MKTTKEEKIKKDFIQSQDISYVKRDCEHCFCQTEIVGGSIGSYGAKPGLEHEKCCMCSIRRVKRGL